MPRILYRMTRSRRAGFVRASELMVQELAGTLDDVIKPELLQRFRFVVANWSSDVDFKARKEIKPGSISVIVWPVGSDKKIYGYVTKGTPPHKIKARNVPYLAYMWGGKGSYKPKTKPGGKIGGPGVVRGGTLRRPAEVDHPGTEARDFEKEIMRDLSPWFKRQMDNAFRRGLRRAAVS